MTKQRLLAFIDILGWTKACESSDLEPMLSALAIIHRQGEVFSERARQEAISAKGAVINPLYLEVQFGAFSDHFVFSKPADFGGRIFSVAKICLDLLKIGFLTRGAIVLGKLYHQDNIIFGPALIDAVRIEETEAFFPRIIVADNVIQHCEELGHLGELRRHFVIEDQDGRSILNMFCMPEYGQNAEWDKSTIALNIPMRVIWKTINDKIQLYHSPESRRYREKWIYLKDVIENRVFSIYPALKMAVENRSD